jgi:argininosuccinate lyase
VALDLAEVLVARGVPFREAHHAVGELVARLKAEGRDFSTVTAGELEATDPRLVPEDLGLLDPKGSVEARLTPRGGSFVSVAQQIDELRSRLP